MAKTKVIAKIKCLDDMVYAGRGVIVGKTPSNDDFIGYLLTGRSPSSQARELLEGEKTKTIRTNVITEEKRLRRMFEITDDEKLAKLRDDLKKGSPALLLYPAMAHYNRVLMASNGAQTKLIYSAVKRNETALKEGNMDIVRVVKEAFSKPFFEYDQKNDEWIDITSYEPDAPIFTPRVSGAVYDGTGVLHIISRNPDGSNNKKVYSLRLRPGQCYAITTYKGGNEKPVVLPFEDAPLEFRTKRGEKDIMVQINGPVINLTNDIYESIKGGEKPEENFRVAAAAMVLKKNGSLYTDIKNRIEVGI